MGNRNENNTPRRGSDVPSTLVSRNIKVHGNRTSVRLESEMWAALFDICRRERHSIHDICSLVADRKREGSSLTAAIRVFIMAYYRAAATEEGHAMVGHGQGLHNLPGRRSGSGRRAEGARGVLRRRDAIKDSETGQDPTAVTSVANQSTIPDEGEGVAQIGGKAGAHR